jgi:hypothetical protein
MARFSEAYYRLLAVRFRKRIFAGKDQSLHQDLTVSNDSYTCTVYERDGWFVLHHFLAGLRRDLSCQSRERKPEQLHGRRLLRSHHRRSCNHTFQHLPRCQNSDFRAQNAFAVWTFLTRGENDNYLQGAVKLGRSLRRHVLNTTAADLIVMQMAGAEVDASWVEQLLEAGWDSMCTVERVPPKFATFPRFADQFTKLQLWGMTDYDAIAYIDADALLVGDGTELFSNETLRPLRQANGVGIRAAQDIRAGEWVNGFNMGVFVMVPTAHEYGRLIGLQQCNGVRYEQEMAEQGFLNAVYKNKKHWHKLDFTFNANLAAYTEQREFWDAHEKEIRIVHYTMQKPWECDGAYENICAWWKGV